MTSAEVNLTRVLKSRGVTWLIILLSLSASCYSFFHSAVEPLETDFGIWIKSPQLWMADYPVWNFLCNIMGCFICALLMVAINRTFNLLRTVSDIFVGIFFVFQAAIPASMAVFSGGVILVSIVLVSMMMFFSIYHKPFVTQRIFLIFFLSAFGFLWEYGFLFYILLFLVECSQMRILSFRGLLAIIMGLVTPFWILWGFGWISFDAVNPYSFSGFFDFSRFNAQPPVVICLVITLFIGLIAGIMNTLKVISFNNQSRAFFSFLSAIGILSGILCVIDNANLMFYLPLLYCITAMQVSMYMRLYDKTRAYIIFPLILLFCSLIYLWSLAI